MGSKSRDPMDLFKAAGSGCHDLVSKVIGSHSLGRRFITDAIAEIDRVADKGESLSLIGGHLRIALDAVSRGLTMDQMVDKMEKEARS